MENANSVLPPRSQGRKLESPSDANGARSRGDRGLLGFEADMLDLPRKVHVEFEVVSLPHAVDARRGPRGPHET